jgi:hypothetical protein
MAAASTLQQRCWNHEEREAACRCPGCLRSFCRECVTEHESRLLCAACLNAAARVARTRHGRIRRVVPLGMAGAGLILAWLVFYGAGEILLESSTHMERTAWQDR